MRKREDLYGSNLTQHGPRGPQRPVPGFIPSPGGWRGRSEGGTSLKKGPLKPGEGDLLPASEVQDWSAVSMLVSDVGCGGIKIYTSTPVSPDF